MTIETKYNIGDEVWFMCENKELQSYIDDIRVMCEKENTIKISYWVKPLNVRGKGNWLYHEQNLFPTKQELLKSL